MPDLKPRFIRAGKVPAYLGMSRTVFTRDARPHLIEFSIGKQGIGFDRIELDQFAERCKQVHAVEKDI